MATTIRWRAMPRAACFYAAGRLAAGRSPAQPEIAAALGEPTERLVRFLAGAGLPVGAVCERLVGVAGGADSMRETARKALTRAVGAGSAEPHAAAVGGLISSLEAACDLAFPKLGDELELRSRPLRELWEAHGPGLLAAIGRSTDKRLLVDEATVLLVQPFAAGGGGAAYAATNTVALEAVLANPHPRLPETVRLAWLVSQLSADLPDFVEALPPGTAEAVMAWGMLPAALDAAADLEVVRPGADLPALAAEAWELPTPQRPPEAALPVDAGPSTAVPGDTVSGDTVSGDTVSGDTVSAATLGEVTAGWWSAYRARPVPFAVALAALARLFQEAGGQGSREATGPGN